MKKHGSVVLIVIALLLIAGACCCFLRCWDYGIVDLDDYIYLLYHDQVSNFSGLRSLKYFFTSVEEGIWMPLTWMSYAVDYMLFGDWFGGFHLHSVFIHAINACLVFWLLRMLFDGDGRTTTLCLLASLAWAVHPLRCESVVFLASRKDVLSFFWELLALICWVGGSRRNLNGQGATWQTALATLFFVVASMCKPSVMTFPVLCFLIDAFIHREVRMFRYAAPVAYMLFLGAFAAWQQKSGGATFDPFHQPLHGRMLGAVAAYGIYVRNTVWPQWLAPQCVKTWPDLPRFLLPGLTITGAAAWYLVRRALGYWDGRREIVTVHRWHGVPARLTSSAERDYAFASIAWFSVAIAPMLGIASFGYHSFADRFTYIPAVGLSVLLVHLARRLPRGAQTAASAALLAACAALAVRTWHQTGYWEDDDKLFSHTLEVDGDHNGCAHGILANWSFEFPHDLERSVEEFDKALGRDMNYVMPCYNIYVIALAESGREGRILEALRRYRDEVGRQVGPERASAVWGGNYGLGKDEQFYRSMYHCCRLAWNLADGNVSLRGAEGIVSQLDGPALEKDPVWLYLLMKYNLLSGNEGEASRLLDLLLAPKGKVGYIQFRYLRGKPKEEIFRSILDKTGQEPAGA